jgi:formate dehydrogenase iron-sulfur subunit
MPAASTGDGRPDAAAMTAAEASAYYSLYRRVLRDEACQGLACYAARADDPARWAAAQVEPAIHCLGRCHAAPAAVDGDPAPHIASTLVASPLLQRVLDGGALTLAAYRDGGGGRGLLCARRMTAAQLIDSIERSGLRGRGGAGFAAGYKWRAVAQAPGPLKYVVANADEGDAGTFGDRVLLERDPFLLIEGMAIAARAIGAQHGCIYLRKEYPAAAAVLRAALAEARASGWLDSAFEIELVIGAGSYVCGEETAMLEAIEGRRPQPRPRPPQITTQGLFGRPTLVHNVETLCAVPWIVERGAAAYAALGCGRSRGSKLLSLNSLFRRPGLYEVPFGISLHQIVDELGGGLRRGELRALMIGGPLAGLLPPALLDTPLDYEALAAVGGAVGHGGVIAFADDSSIAGIAEQVLRFGALESCGKCVPCHRGSPKLARLFVAAGAGTLDRAEWTNLLAALAETSLCGHGRGLAEFARSIERHFGAELGACLA